MVRALGYVRVSTSRQANEGISLEAQETKLRAMASLKDYDLAEIICDDASGKSLNRPGLKHLLSLVEARSVQAVIIAKLDRLTRSLKDLLNLLEVFKKNGVTLISINESLDTETAIGRLMCNLLGSINEFERENISARVTESLAYKASKGGCVGSVPYGFVKTGSRKQSSLSPNDGEMAVIERMKALKASGSTLRSISDTLASEGSYNRSGKAFDVAFIHRIINRDVDQPTSESIN